MPENQNIEWKESWRDEYLKWICGFANAKGGKIIIGKNDNGEVEVQNKNLKGMHSINFFYKKLAKLGMMLLNHERNLMILILWQLRHSKKVQQQAKDYRLLQMKKILSKFLITFVKGGLIEAWGRGTIKIIKENRNITNKIYQEICEVSKATATRDLTELIEKFKLLERSGEVGAGTSYKLIGS